MEAYEQSQFIGIFLRYNFQVVYIITFATKLRKFVSTVILEKWFCKYVRLHVDQKLAISGCVAITTGEKIVKIT